MVSLKNIITHILQQHGFEVFEKDGILHGVRGKDAVTVGIYDRTRVSDIRAHAEKVSDTPGRHVICVLEAGDAAEEEAKRLGLMLWKRGDLEAEIGRMLVDRISENRGSAFAGLVEGENAQPEIFIGAPGGEAALPPDMPRLVLDSVGTEWVPKVLRSNLSLEDVREISRNTVQGFKHDLELVPYYVFNYSCTYTGKDGREIQASGILAVNALTGAYYGWEKEPEMESGPMHAVQLEPKIDEDAAIRIAVHAVARLNTEFKEIVVEREHTTIIEKAVFRPEEENIRLERHTLVLVPVWCVEGKHGVMILDGITGKIISEDYYDND